MRGLLPAETAELEKRVPGVGRYTAGAISAIVFGRAAPMVDGNVVRVLTRQLGIFGSAKTNKSVSDAIWDVADALVRTVAQDPSQDVAGDGEAPVSDRPGRWGQALMELGSTICTPKPDCSRCPITSTCRAYAEGLSIADGPARTNGTGATTLVDIEDLCQLCEPFDEDAVPGGINDCDDLAQTATRADDKPSRSRRAKVTQTVNISNGEKASTESPPSADTMAVIVDHARKFPPKAIKKAVREEECLVCAILRSDGQYLIHRRPSKGLLAGLWELPSHTLPASNQSTAQSRKRGAAAYVAGLFPDCAEKSQRQKRPRLKHCGELGSVPWLFSHLKLTMHVHLFTLDHRADQSIIMARADQLHRWASDGEVDGESMGTGMRKCWALVRDCDTAQ
ncbi:DNA glycosylase [Phialemonium atrogriseum]|uniref:Adenine DNA glycosylase n=1 Tax=Phialemonium atrogriseum TaxID=1093897 RepID=A0AAJ0BWW8_9PEZI|nr:DNA glycosylase [Phialemonium atrogriseum]KAK1765965.1 DNA glycosylase [Phialemonium atrogriseum]